MLATNLICFYLCFVPVSQIMSSTQVNTTTSDGKVFISGDRNEVVVSTARESKINLIDNESKSRSTMSKKDKEFLRKLQALDNRMLSLDKIRGNLETMNQTIQTLSKAVVEKDKLISKKLQAFDHDQKFSLGDIREKLNGVMNQTIKPLARTVDLLNKSIKRMNKSNAGLFAQFQSISERFSVFERHANNYALHFPRKGTSDYVIITRGMPSLKAVTVCLWMKSSDKKSSATPLSYAVPGRNEELVLYMNNRKFRFFAGKGERQTPVSASDGKWHHICATWENTAGSWKLYKDGKVEAADKGLSAGHVLRGGGALVLGQEQDSLGGSFDANQCFIGELAGVNIWDHVIKEQQIMRMSKSCLSGVGNVFQWRDFKPHVKGSVKITKPSC